VVIKLNSSFVGCQAETVAITTHSEYEKKAKFAQVSKYFLSDESTKVCKIVRTGVETEENTMKRVNDAKHVLECDSEEPVFGGPK
jgi:hypothetical protein